jgi:hypothetical protein
VYDSEEGINIHVAANRYISETPRPELPKSTDNSEDDSKLFEYWEQCDIWVRKAQTEKIGLPFDGKNYVFGDIEEAVLKLKELRATGYRVPQYVVDELIENLNEEKK